MYASDARPWIRQHARNSTDNSAYSDGDVDRALLLVINDFLRFTRASRRSDSLSLSSGSSALPTLPTGFRPELALRAWISGQTERDLEIVDYDIIRQWLSDDASQAIPRAVAFTSDTAGVAYPTPGAAYTMILEWRKMQAAWVPGAVLAPVATTTLTGGAVSAITLTSGGGRYSVAPTVTLTAAPPGGTNATATCAIETTYGQVTGFTITNAGAGYLTAPAVRFSSGSADQLLLPADDLLPVILADGAAGHLQIADPTHASIAAAKWARYLDFRRTMAAAGNLGAQAVHRDTL